MEYPTTMVDRPKEYVQRIIFNRPDQRNALSNELRGELFHSPEAADLDESIRATP